MTTETRAGWPTQIMLPGQTAAPEGPVDMSMMYVFHHAFRRDLSRFLAAVRDTPVSDAAAWDRLGRRWAVFSRQLHHHHEAEDRALWPWLRSRAGEGELALLDCMEEEHSAIDPGLTTVTAGFRDMTTTAGRTADTRAALTVRLTGVRQVLDQHLGHEERDAMALLQRTTTQKEWDALEKQFAEGQPFSAVCEMLPWAVDGLDDAVVRRILAGAPLPLRVLLALFSPGFRRRERAVFAR